MRLNLNIRHIDPEIDEFLITSYGFDKKGQEEYSNRKEKIVYGVDGLVNYIRKLDA